MARSNWAEVDALPKPELPRGRRSILGLMGIVVIAAINLKVWVDSERQTRRSFADHFARLAESYRRAGQPTTAAWNDHMSRQYAAAVQQPWTPKPELIWQPPPGWSPPKPELTPVQP